MNHLVRLRHHQRHPPQEGKQIRPKSSCALIPLPVHVQSQLKIRFSHMIFLKKIVWSPEGRGRSEVLDVWHVTQLVPEVRKVYEIEEGVPTLYPSEDKTQTVASIFARSRVLCIVPCTPLGGSVILVNSPQMGRCTSSACFMLMCHFVRLLFVQGQQGCVQHFKEHCNGACEN